MNNQIAKLGQVIHIVNENIFGKYFESLKGLMLSSRPFLIYQPAAIMQ